MRKNYVLSLAAGIGLCCATGAMAQEFGAVRPIDRQVSVARARQLFGKEAYSPFKMSTAAARPGAGQVVSQATYLDMQPEQTLRIYKERPAAFSMSIPQRSGLPLELELVQQSPLTEDFAVITSDSKGQPVPYTPGVYYRGIIKGDPGSIVAVSIFKDEIIGVAATKQHGNMVLGRLEEQGNLSSYILYSDQDLKIANTGNCYAETLPEYLEEIKDLSGIGAKPTVDKCVRVYMECDYALRVNKGSVTNTVNYITAVFNNVAALYANESITTYISGTFVWNSADSYSSTANTALTQFRNLRPTFNGDLAHLVAYKTGSSFAGIAWVNALCSTYRYAYSQIQATYNTVPTFSWTVEVITHEMGHNLGSPHTHNCTAWTGGPIDGCAPTYNAAYAEGSCAPGPIPSSTVKGTIMSYCHLLSNVGINFSNGFGPQPGNLIRSRITAASCLSTCSSTNTAGAPDSRNGLATTAAASQNDFTVYPNPASDRLYLNWISREKGMTRIVLTDLSGREIETRILTSAAGANSFVLQLNLKVTGMYLIRLENGTDVSWRKVTIR